MFEYQKTVSLQTASEQLQADEAESLPLVGKNKKNRLPETEPGTRESGFDIEFPPRQTRSEESEQRMHWEHGKETPEAREQDKDSGSRQGSNEKAVPYLQNIHSRKKGSNGEMFSQQKLSILLTLYGHDKNHLRKIPRRKKTHSERKSGQASPGICRRFRNKRLCF